jgi:hypothetical protein
MTDTLFINCHFCGRRIASKGVEDHQNLSPSLAIRWHERMIAHIRREHQGKEDKP